MPRTLTPARKLTALVSLALHLVVVGVVPFVDGGLEAAAPDHRAHIEAPGDAGCAPLHDHLTCQFCRVLGRDLLGSTPDGVGPSSGPTACGSPVTAKAAPHITAARSAHGPRAPPIV